MKKKEHYSQDVTNVKQGIEGRYANYAEVGYNAFEFVFNFGQFYTDNSDSRIHTHIIMNPLQGKILMKILRESIAQYEKLYGEIREK